MRPILGPDEEIMARQNGNGSAPRTSSKSSKKLSTHEQIEMRAYEIYLERNGAPGDPLADWIRAEQEVVSKPKKAKAAKKVLAASAA
jgi:hypothetical protein